MTVTDKACRNDYVQVTPGTNVTFPYTFRIFEDTELLVYVDDVLQDLTDDYTVTGADDPDGGNVVFVTAPTTAAVVAIVCNIASEQPTSFADAGPFPAEDVELALDRAVMLGKQVEEKLGRVVQLPVTVTGTGVLEDAPAEGTVLGWAGGKLKNLAAATAALASDLLSSALAKGDALITVKQNLTGAVATSQHEVNSRLVSVADFGAVGDGSTDDTAAIQAAIDALTAGGMLLFPAGDFKITAALTIAVDGVGVKGAGAGVSIIRAFGGGYNALSLVPPSGTLGFISVRALTITGLDGARTGTGHGIYMHRGVYCLFEHLSVSYHPESGIYLEDSISNAVRDCYILENGAGISLVDTLGGYTNHNRLEGNAIYNHTDYGVLIDGGESNHVTRTWFENIESAAMTATHVAIHSTAHTANGNVIAYNNFAKTQTATSHGIDLLGATLDVFRTHIVGNHFALTTSGGDGIRLDETNTTLITGNHFSTVGTACYAIVLVSDTETRRTTIPPTNTGTLVVSGKGLQTVQAISDTTNSRIDYRAKLRVEKGTSEDYSPVQTTASVITTAVKTVGAGEDVLMTYDLPANSMVVTGSGVKITAWGTAANNVNAKTLKLYFGSAVILTTALTASQVDTWRIEATVLRTGASTQDYSAQLLQAGTAALVDVENGALTQTETAAITIKCTGEATTNDDIAQEGMVVSFIHA